MLSILGGSGINSDDGHNDITVLHSNRAPNVNCHFLQPIEYAISELHFQLSNFTVDMIGSNPHDIFSFS